nr:MAG TPA: hypothetical protein [Caudoviricetes sp.]
MIQYHCRKVSVSSHFPSFAGFNRPAHREGRSFAWVQLPCSRKIHQTNTTKGEQTNG